MSTTTPTARNLSSRRFPLQLLCEMARVVNDSSRELLKYGHLIKWQEVQPIWTTTLAKEVGHLAQEIPGLVKGTNTIKFIAKEDIPVEQRKDTTYTQIVCNE